MQPNQPVQPISPGGAPIPPPTVPIPPGATADTVNAERSDAFAPTPLPNTGSDAVTQPIPAAPVVAEDPATAPRLGAPTLDNDVASAAATAPNAALQPGTPNNLATQPGAVVSPDVPAVPAQNPAHVFNGDTLVSTSLESLGSDDPAAAQFASDVDAGLSKAVPYLQGLVDKIIDGGIADVEKLNLAETNFAASVEAVIENKTSPTVGGVLKAAAGIASAIAMPAAYSVNAKLLAGLKAFRADIDGLHI